MADNGYGYGRKGKPFCLRLTDSDRELLTRALEAERLRRQRAREGYYWQKVSLGEFIRSASVRRATELLEASTRSAGTGNTPSSAEKKAAGRRR